MKREIAGHESQIAGSNRTVRRLLLASLVLLALLVLAASVIYLVRLPIAYDIALSTWLHSLATIVWIGYFLFTSLIYLPIFERQMPANALRELLEQVSARLRPLFGGSLLIFLVTGTYLMLINSNYLGFGDFFGNSWSILIVAKHVLVLAFLTLAIFSERAFLGQISDQNPQALTRFRWASSINAALGVIILLLTSIAQAG